MTKPFTLLTTAACLFAFLILAPTSPAQNPAAEEKVIALAQQLKLTPQQEVEVMPILKAEAPKFEAIKNDPSMSGMQKMEATSCHPQRKRASVAENSYPGAVSRATGYSRSRHQEGGRGKARRALIEQKNSTGANGENRDPE